MNEIMSKDEIFNELDEADKTLSVVSNLKREIYNLDYTIRKPLSGIIIFLIMDAGVGFALQGIANKLYFLLIPSVVLWLIGNALIVRNKKIKAENEETQAIIDGKKEEVRQAYAACKSRIPRRYIYEDGLNYLYAIVKANRVSSLNEALDKLDEQEHRWKLERQNQAIIDNQITQNETLKSIKADTYWI